MLEYLVNVQTGDHGENEIHKIGCSYLPDPSNWRLLGWFYSDQEALQEAHRQGYQNADGCFWCCRSIHSR